MTERKPEDNVVETVERIGDETAKLLDEVRESLRENLEQVEWRWHHIESRLADLRKQLAKPKADAEKAAVRFGAEMKKSSGVIYRTLRDFSRN